MILLVTLALANTLLLGTTNAMGLTSLSGIEIVNGSYVKDTNSSGSDYIDTNSSGSVYDYQGNYGAILYDLVTNNNKVNKYIRNISPPNSSDSCTDGTDYSNITTILDGCRAVVPYYGKPYQLPPRAYHYCSGGLDNQIGIGAGSVIVHINGTYSYNEQFTSFVYSCSGIDLTTGTILDTNTSINSQYTFRIGCQDTRKTRSINFKGNYSGIADSPGGFLLINEVKPTASNDWSFQAYDNLYHRNSNYAEWEVPFSGKCGDTLTITPKSLNGLFDGVFTSISVNYCDLTITSLTTSRQKINPSSGESTTINGNITDSSSQPITWSLKVLDRTFSGSGTSVSATWDGKDANGNVVAPGFYTATLTAQTADGQCVDSKTINIEVISCSLSITSLTSTSQTLDPTFGGSIGINGIVSDSSGQAINWTLKILDNTFSGSGTSPNAVWSGKYANGTVVNPGTYPAILAAQTTTGLCTDSKTVNITVVKPDPKDLDDCTDPCGCNQTKTNSNVNLKSGNYYHSQNVITKPETLSLDLTYNSLESLDIPLGKGWSHTYNIILKEITAGNITLKLGGGDIRNFVLSGSTYLPESTSNDTTSIIKNADNSYTRTFKNGATQTFNSSGQLTTIIDINGNKTTLTYSGSDLTNISDPTGRTLTITSTGGRISSIKDPAGRITTFTYNGNLLASVTDPSGNSWNYVYDANSQMVQKTTPAGNQSTNVYDATGKNTSSTDPEGKTKTISYDSATSSTVTEKDGSTWTRAYDPALNVPTATTDPLGNITNKTFDSKGNLLTISTPDGRVTSYTYDTNNNLLTETDPLGKITSYTYNVKGQVLTKTDPDGHTTTNSYDAKGNLLQTVNATGAKTVFTYDTKGNLLTITDPLAKKITYAYDTKNNVISITDQNAKVTSFTYDAVGNMLTRKDAALKITTYVYDVMNRLTKITDPLGYITLFTYDKMGNKLTATDGNGKVTTYTYNYKNQPLTTIDALGNTTTMAYSGSGCGSCGGEGNGKLVSVTDASGNVTRYEYNLNGKLAKEIDPKGNITSYSYDNNGRLTSRIDGNARTTNYFYDAADRLISRTYQDGRNDTFTYDPAGNLLTASNANISYTLTRDANNRLTGVTDNYGRAITYVLDANGNRTKMTAPDGRITTYTYDAKNNLTKLTDNGKIYSLTYDTLDRRTKLTNPNGTNSIYTYDADGRITALSTKTSKSKVINSISHGYDKTANRTTNIEPAGTTNYSYDAVYRLIKTALGTTTKEQFTYDVTGNRTTGPTVATAYIIDQGNQLKSKTGATYTYDNNGNQITKTESGTTYTYTYDGENRLENVVRTSGTTTTTTTFKYDPFGNRIEKTVNGVTTKYLYDGANILYEYDGSNVITARYTHNLTIDDPLGLEKGGKLYAYHKDTLGSIRAITDSTQAIINTYSYDSFGNMTQTGTLSQPYAYAGRELDKETGLYYYRARYYDPSIGRFIQRDPISFAGGDVNLYGYVQNNPINWIDPDGNIAIPAVVGVAVVATGTVAIITNYRTNPNKKGSIPNYKKPQKPGQCSYKGPPPDGFDYLNILAGTSIAQFASDFIEGAVPGGPPPPTFGGLLGNIVGDALENLRK